MISLPLAYWVVIAVAALTVVLAAALLLTRGRHVEIEQPTLDGRIVGPTLVRRPPPTLATEVPTVPLEFLSVETPTGAPDDLLRMKGVGPRLAARLNDLGIVRYDQIAAWTDADVVAVDAQLGSFAGRIVRDRWIEQARYLAANDVLGFEAAFGRITPAPTAQSTGPDVAA